MVSLFSDKKDQADKNYTCEDEDDGRWRKEIHTTPVGTRNKNPTGSMSPLMAGSSLIAKKRLRRPLAARLGHPKRLLAQTFRRRLPALCS